MPNYTSNYRLKKPLQDEFYNIDDHNGNMDIIDEELKKRATLDENGKVPSSQLPEIQLPEMNFIPTSEKGAVNGVPTLDSTGKIPSSQLPETQFPEMNFIPTNEKGVANGVATLSSSGKVPTSQLPDDIGGGGKRTVRFTIGSSQYGWTANDCDYLCDGSADEVQIKSAIQALRTTGGEIVLLDGLYNISSTIIINKDNVTLVGNGANTKLIRAFNDDEYSSEAGLIVITKSYCTIKNLHIDCKKSNYTSNNAINIISGDNCVITNNTIINSSCEGIYAEGDYHSITNNTITGSDDNGLYLCNCNKAMVTDNHIIGSAVFGIYLYNVNDSIINNNICQDGSDSGIKLENCNTTCFSGNVLNNNGQCGIYIPRGESNIICGNTFVENSNYGVYLNTSATKNVIMSNVYTGNKVGDVNNVGSNNTVHLPNHTHSGADITTGLDVLATAMGAARIQTGNYSGTGTYGKSNKCVLTFDFVPKAVWLTGTKFSNGEPIQYCDDIILVNGMVERIITSSVTTAASTQRFINLTWDGNTLSYYGYDARDQFNDTMFKYHWVALG